VDWLALLLLYYATASHLLSLKSVRSAEKSWTGKEFRAPTKGVGAVKTTTMSLSNLLAAMDLEVEPNFGYQPQKSGEIIVVNLRYIKLLGVTRKHEGVLCFENGDLRIPIPKVKEEHIAFVADLRHRKFDAVVSITDKSMASIGFTAERPGVFVKGESRMIYDYSTQCASFYDDRGMVFQDFRLFTIDQVKIILQLCT